MTAVVSVGSRLVDGARTIIRAPFEVVGGGLVGHRAYLAGATSVTVPAATSGTIAETVGLFLRRVFGNLFAGGLSSLNASVNGLTVGQAFRNVVTSGTGAFGTNFAALGTRLAATGGRGLLLLGGHVGLAAIGIAMGAQLAISAYKKYSSEMKGYYADNVKMPTVHLLQAFTGLTTAIGGAMMFVNPAVGLATVAAGFAGSMALGVVKYFVGGLNWFRYPNLAPYPLNKLFASHKNLGIYEGTM